MRFKMHVPCSHVYRNSQEKKCWKIPEGKSKEEEHAEVLELLLDKRDTGRRLLHQRVEDKTKKENTQT